ncbi:NUDIX hydrolase [Cytobacillus sp. FSL R5-0596]|uniref:NUDIX hydrolase n=1 Tax=Cytobacillus sp. FSL R5-0596 TaxID=2954696 RepID=UPI0030F53ED4
MQYVFTRVLIKDTDNNILVVQDRASIWNFPGGKLESNETPIECAKREVKEEVGLYVSELNEIIHKDIYFENKKWHGYFYLATSVSGSPTLNEFDKIKGIQFVNNFEKVKFPLELSSITKEIFSSPSFQEKKTIWY